MSLCPFCGLNPNPSYQDAGICTAHDGSLGTWADVNRVACDFFHRGVHAPNDPGVVLDIA